MVFQRKRKTRRGRSATARKPSKPLVKAIKNVMARNIETKTINVPLLPGGTSNSNNNQYFALSGINYLSQDVFRVPQGVTDATTFNAGNRIGDRVKGVGFLMDYYFTTRTSYTLGGLVVNIPFVKLRVTVYKTAFGYPLLPTPLVFDNNFNQANTSTLQPINWAEGYVKDVLFDKVFVIRNDNSYLGPPPGVGAVMGNVLHFKKYIKYNHLIKYMENNLTTPNNTDKPIYVSICAEVDDANVGLVPSGTLILNWTGYTRAWFKDA